MSAESLFRLGRRLVAPTLLDTATHYAHALVSDGHGGHTSAWTTVVKTFACRVVGVKDQLASSVGDVLQGPATAVILCEYGTELPDGDRVAVNGVTYQIGARISAESVTTVVERYIGREV